MPVRVARRGGKWRLVEGDGTVAATEKGNARDGGGHRTREMAQAQANAINRSLKGLKSEGKRRGGPKARQGHKQ